jgi:hypothetical protein
VLEVATHDRLLLRVRGEPAFPTADELLDLVLGHPVVLVVVEHRQEDVEMLEQLLEPLRAGQRHREVPARSPVRTRLVQREPPSHDRVPEGLEETPQERLASATRQDGETRFPRKLARGELRPLLAPPGERRGEHPRQGDAEERGRHVGSVVDVLLELAALTGRSSPTADEPDGIDLEQQRGRAALRVGPRIDDVRLPEGQLEEVRPKRALVEQEAQIRGRRSRAGKREQHRSRGA